MRWRAAVMSFLLAGPVMAGEAKYLSTDGGVFHLQKNVHGAVLTSVPVEDGPVLSIGEADPRLKPGEVLYLGKSCDAFSEALGEGTWRWTDGGFIARFARGTLAFPGQQITTLQAEACRLLN